MKISHLIHVFRRYATLNNAAVVIAALIALSWLWGTVTTLQKNFALQQQVDALDEQIELRSLERDTLNFQQQYYRSDEYLELAARDQLNKASPGEKLIILPPLAVPDQEEEASSASDDELEVSNFEQWMRFFFGRNTSS